jgi:uncharacterized alkaline shock family protein YloU
MDEHPTMPYPGPPAGADPPAEAPVGEAWIADAIVAKVAAAAAREVDGVARLRGGLSRRGFIRGSERRLGGALVQVRDGVVSVSVRLVVLEGYAIPRIIESVRERVIERIGFATGMSVDHVDIGVVDVVPRSEARPAGAGAPPATA